MLLRSHLWLWLVLPALVLCVACQRRDAISVRDAEQDPSGQRGRLISVHGCYHNGPESALLQPCAEPKREEVVWVISRTQLENTAKAIPGYAMGSAERESPSAQERTLADRLAGLSDGVFAEVVLRGELRSSPTFEFGPSPGYRHEFIVHRVLSVSSR